MKEHTKLKKVYMVISNRFNLMSFGEENIDMQKYLTILIFKIRKSTFNLMMTWEWNIST